MAKHSVDPDFSSEDLEEPEDKNAGKRRVLLVIGIVCVLVAIGAIAYIIGSQWSLLQSQQQLEELNQNVHVSDPEPANTEVEDPKANLPENPIDWAELKEQNNEVYAYISIPNTNIDYPILQSATDDNYYLDRNINGVVSIEGALYTQSANHADFHDPVTVIYGHNIYNPEMMFHQLYKFADEDFFAENDTFYIYTQNAILTYQIVAAYEYDNRHILNSFDFSKTSVVESYFATVLQPTSLTQNVRSGATLTAADHIVQLSTCLETGNSAGRYLVTGKLVSEQATK